MIYTFEHYISDYDTNEMRVNEFISENQLKIYLSDRLIGLTFEEAEDTLKQIKVIKGEELHPTIFEVVKCLQIKI